MVFERVSFVDCVLDEVDAFEGLLEDVNFPGSRLTGVNVDRQDATSVDLREAIEISLQGVGRLDGCLVAEHQLPALAYTLALAAGIDIERLPHHDDP